ncbi:MAG: DNA repair photolyase [Cyclobacteriaceae bacterium]|jgi:DNA repair photolyase
MIKGQGAQINPPNPFSKSAVVTAHWEGIDEYDSDKTSEVEIFYESPKNVLSRNSSEDIGFEYSINPYQGCEHGCIYCYARNSHTYWGFSAGLDFERKIIVKKDVAKKFEERILSKNWKVQPVMLSGNTDCYQPIEREYKLTRQLLEVALKYQHPITILTKNTLILRDLDILSALAKLHLVHVAFSITTLDEKLRLKLEPRTASAKKKLQAIEMMANAQIPVMVMNAPIIPGLNDHEIPKVIQAASDAGASDINFTVVRLNGQVGELFKNWIVEAYADKASKVLNQIKEMHGGKLNDSKWKERMSGKGNYALMINELFRKSKQRYFQDKKMPPLNVTLFRRGGNYSLF